MGGAGGADDGAVGQDHFDWTQAVQRQAVAPRGGPEAADGGVASDSHGGGGAVGDHAFSVVVEPFHHGLETIGRADGGDVSVSVDSELVEVLEVDDCGSISAADAYEELSVSDKQSKRGKWYICSHNRDHHFSLELCGCSPMRT